MRFCLADSVKRWDAYVPTRKCAQYMTHLFQSLYAMTVAIPACVRLFMVCMYACSSACKHASQEETHTRYSCRCLLW